MGPQFPDFFLYVFIIPPLRAFIVETYFVLLFLIIGLSVQLFIHLPIVATPHTHPREQESGG